jgi:hypothetical protein
MSIAFGITAEQIEEMIVNVSAFLRNQVGQRVDLRVEAGIRQRTPEPGDAYLTYERTGGHRLTIVVNDAAGCEPVVTNVSLNLDGAQIVKAVATRIKSAGYGD